MNRTEFIKRLIVMTPQEINEFIKENGKKKEPESYNTPWRIVIKPNSL